MSSANAASVKGAAIAVAHGLVGWMLCGVTVGVGRKVATLETTLIVHAVAAPLIFAALSLAYFRRSGAWSPLRTAATFLGIVAGMDAFVVAPFLEHSFAMFGSVLGTWLPFLLIFLATWLTGRAVKPSLSGKRL